MELVRQTVPYGNAGIFRKLLDDLLAVSSVLYAVIHTAEHSRRIGDRLLTPDLRACGVKVSHVHTEIVSGHFKGTAGSGAGLLKYQSNVFAAQSIVCDPALLLVFELGSQIHEIQDLLRFIIHQFQEVSAF